MAIFVFFNNLQMSSIQVHTCIMVIANVGLVLAYASIVIVMRVFLLGLS